MRLHERKNAFTSLILIHFYYLIQLAKFLFIGELIVSQNLTKIKVFLQ